MKEPNYVMMMVATGGRLLAGDTCKETVKNGRKTENTCLRHSSTSWHLIGIFVTAMQLTTKTTSGIHYHKLNIHGWLISGSVGYLLSFWTSQRLMHFWFCTIFPTVGYIRRECPRYWIFVGSWCGNLLKICTLGNGRGELSSCQNPFIGWWLNQGTR